MSKVKWCEGEDLNPTCSLNFKDTAQCYPYLLTMRCGVLSVTLTRCRDNPRIVPTAVGSKVFRRAVTLKLRNTTEKRLVTASLFYPHVPNKVMKMKKT